jgi:Tfp pilus assembly protein PilV
MEMSNKQTCRLRLYKGQSFIEVVIALALISIVLITLVAMAALSIRASVFSRNQTEASRYTEQAAEWLRSEKDASWSTFRSHAAIPNWCLDSLYWQKQISCSGSDVISGTVFTRSLKFTVNADGSVSADLSTTWIDAQGTHSVPTSLIFTNWQ